MQYLHGNNFFSDEAIRKEYTPFDLSSFLFYMLSYLGSRIFPKNRKYKSQH